MGEHISFDQITMGDSDVVWGLLWALGYLKAVDHPTESNRSCQLKIPNYEVQYSYEQIFLKLIRGFDEKNYDACIKWLVEESV